MLPLGAIQGIPSGFRGRRVPLQALVDSGGESDNDSGGDEAIKRAVWTRGGGQFRRPRRLVWDGDGQGFGSQVPAVPGLGDGGSRALRRPGLGKLFGEVGTLSHAPSKKDAESTGPTPWWVDLPPPPCPDWGSGSFKCILDN